MGVCASVRVWWDADVKHESRDFEISRPTLPSPNRRTADAPRVAEARHSLTQAFFCGTEQAPSGKRGFLRW